MGNKKRLDHKIWGIAWPAILSNISIPVMGLVDAAILGHLGSTEYLGAVAIGSALLSFLYWGFSFLRMGTTGLVARAMGAGNPQQASLVLIQSAVLALILSAAVLLLYPLWLRAGFALMSPQLELESLANSYASIRIYSAPAVLLTYTIVGWFIGRQDTRWPMLIVIVTNGANIGLDFLLIMGLGLHSDGAAMATVMAEYLGCALALVAVWHKLPALPSAWIYRQLVSAMVMSLIFLTLHTTLFSLLTDIPGVRQLMSQHYLWLVLLPLVAAPSYLLDGVFIGSAETRYMMTTMLFSVFIVYLPLWYLTREWGNHGLWLAFTAFNASRGISLYHCYRSLSRSNAWLREPSA